MHRSNIIKIASDIRRYMLEFKIHIPVDPKLQQRYWNLSLGLFRQSGPQHAFGQHKDNKELVDAAIQEEIQAWKEDNPEATDADVHNRRLQFLNAARLSEYNKLSDVDKQKWIEEAKRVAPVDDDELWVVLFLIQCDFSKIRFFEKGVDVGNWGWDCVQFHEYHVRKLAMVYNDIRCLKNTKRHCHLGVSLFVYL